MGIMVRLIRQFSRFRHSAYLVVCLTLVYGALLILAAGCALAHADRSQSHQHHHDEHGSSAQDVLCAWACQATADTAMTVEPPPSVPELVIARFYLAASLPIRSISSVQVHSRAPPDVSFVKIG